MGAERGSSHFNGKMEFSAHDHNPLCQWVNGGEAAGGFSQTDKTVHYLTLSSLRTHTVIWRGREAQRRKSRSKTQPPVFVLVQAQSWKQCLLLSPSGLEIRPVVHLTVDFTSSVSVRVHHHREKAQTGMICVTHSTPFKIHLKTEEGP